MASPVTRGVLFPGRNGVAERPETSLRTAHSSRGAVHDIIERVTMVSSGNRRHHCVVANGVWRWRERHVSAQKWCRGAAVQQSGVRQQKSGISGGNISVSSAGVRNRDRREEAMAKPPRSRRREEAERVATEKIRLLTSSATILREVFERASE